MQTLKQLACFLLSDETGAKVDMFNRKEDKEIDVSLIASRYATSNSENSGHRSFKFCVFAEEDEAAINGISHS